MKRKLVPLALGILAAAGCAHSTNQSLDSKASAESKVATPAELRTEVGLLIESDPNLTPEQKASLQELHASHTAKIDAIEKQSLELKALLVKDLLPQSYNPAEVKDIKNRLRKVEDNRLSALFEAVDKANAIIGLKGSSGNPKMMRAFLGTGARPYRE